MLFCLLPLLFRFPNRCSQYGRCIVETLIHPSIMQLKLLPNFSGGLSYTQILMKFSPSFRGVLWFLLFFLLLLVSFSGPAIREHYPWGTAGTITAGALAKVLVGCARGVDAVVKGRLSAIALDLHADCLRWYGWGAWCICDPVYCRNVRAVACRWFVVSFPCSDCPASLLPIN